MTALPPLIADHLDEVRALCEKHGVKRLTLFGSAVKGTFDPEKSDLDFVVEFLPTAHPIDRGRAYLDLLVGLGDVFGRSIDLVELSGVRNPYFLKVLELTQQPLYEAA